MTRSPCRQSMFCFFRCATSPSSSSRAISARSASAALSVTCAFTSPDRRSNCAARCLGARSITSVCVSCPASTWLGSGSSTRRRYRACGTVIGCAKRERRLLRTWRGGPNRLTFSRVAEMNCSPTSGVMPTVCRSTSPCTRYFATVSLSAASPISYGTCTLALPKLCSPTTIARFEYLSDPATTSDALAEWPFTSTASDKCRNLPWPETSRSSRACWAPVTVITAGPLSMNRSQTCTASSSSPPGLSRRSSTSAGWLPDSSSALTASLSSSAVPRWKFLMRA